MIRWKQTTLVILGVLATALLTLPYFGANSNNFTLSRQHSEAQAPLPTSTVTLTNPDSLTILVIGDSGAGTTSQKKVAQQLILAQQQSGAKTMIHLGDLIYPRGDFLGTGNTLYTQYYKPLMDAGVTLRPVLGNHDVLDGFNPKALDFYRIPNRYYQYTLKDPNLTIDCFAIDTNIFNEITQQQWLEHALKNSHSDWKIVYGHHPMVSSGMHGNNALLQEKLKPLLSRYGVDLYLSGHEHDYERFSPIDGTLHLISGGGGAYLRKFEQPVPGSVKRISTHHLLKLTFYKNRMDGQAIDLNGKTIDQFGVTHRQE